MWKNRTKRPKIPLSGGILQAIGEDIKVDGKTVVPKGTLIEKQRPEPMEKLL